jgi:FkbM family methyltransferase
MPERPVLVESRTTRVRAGRYGNLLYNFHDDTIGRALDLYGEWAQGECDLLAGLLRPGDVVADVGANVGTHMLFFSAIVGDGGCVYAFEPQHEIFQIMAGNAALNGRRNVRAIRAAVGRSAGAAAFTLPDYEVAANFGEVSLLDPVEDGRASETTPVMTIDSLNLPSLALLKIDVEDMELAVLQGAETTIGKHTPVIYAENRGPAQSFRVTSWLLARGYRIFWHAAVAFNADNFAGETLNIFGDAIEHNILCLPHGDTRVPAQLPEIVDPSQYLGRT